MQELQFRANGKLMLTGEYFVLDGAKSLALPTKLGQVLRVKINSDSDKVSWQSIDHRGKIWLHTSFDCTLPHGEMPGNPVEAKLFQLLATCKAMNPNFLNEGAEVEIQSEFDLQWGLGSSSTLVSLLAQWAQVDPFKLQFACFGGSGYDVACATASGPIVYNRWPKPTSRDVVFNPNFANNLHFIFLGQKQDSREGITNYQQQDIDKTPLVLSINNVTESLLECKKLDQFQQLLERHEDIIASNIALQKVKERLFADFDGTCKSLGAWGGDFIMAMSNQGSAYLKGYFESRGFAVIVPYKEMVLARE